MMTKKSNRHFLQKILAILFFIHITLSIRHKSKQKSHKMSKNKQKFKNI